MKYMDRLNKNIDCFLIPNPEACVAVVINMTTRGYEVFEIDENGCPSYILVDKIKKTVEALTERPDQIDDDNIINSQNDLVTFLKWIEA